MVKVFVLPERPIIIMKLSVVVLPVFVYMVYFCSECNASSRLKLESSPGTIHPILAKSLQITCSVQNEKWRAFAITSPMPLENSSTVQESLWNDTSDLVELPIPISSTSAAADFSKLLSLTVTKQNPQTGQNVTIASVVECNTPLIEEKFVGTVKVEGNAEGSPRNGEQGYIRLTWDRPVDKHAGVFKCEANALNSEKHSVVLSASLKVDAVEPKISDLVNYISTNDRYISDLKSKVSEIYEENRILKQQATSLVDKDTVIISRLEQIKSPSIQWGALSCDSSTVKFNPVFNCTPKVLTSLSSLYSSSNNGHFTMSITGLTNSSFVTSCSANYRSISFIWLAIGLCD